jgi:SAM-dependent methyltransferase
MIGQRYGEFLSDVLRSASDHGPFNPAVLRRMENGTQRYLLEPARQLEASGRSAADLAHERKTVQDTLRPLWDRGLFGYEITHWPSGPGSARAMELVYNNNPLPYDVATHYTESFLLSRDLAHAVRSRRDVLRLLMLSELNRDGQLSVLDLANGPCQSLREALPFLRDPRRIHLRGIDTDELAQINNRGFFARDHKLPWTFEVDNVLRAELGHGQHDLVYSTGLYDYLDTPTLTKLWTDVFAALKPGGLAILSVKDGDKFCPLFYRWAIEWSQFHIRQESEFVAMMKQAKLPKPEKVLRDATGCIIFFLVRKPA